MLNVPFVGDDGVDIVVFEDTGDIFPNQTNTTQTNACLAPDRTAQLTITFGEPCPFDIEGLNPTAPNGGGLFFDPYIEVNDTGETISAGDIRLLTVPDTWLWPQERVPIWDVYTEVENDGSNQPVFTTETWFDGGFDSTLIYDRCQ